ncbi:hypothetical protein O3M35_008529 [Rhynocoris fuscipes]|uniref:Uncharacterized protein n=1 Tax=Rhynocoris fuscipes TaxID=488301 RepID=A0AAW1DDK9_9HEMI
MEESRSLNKLYRSRSEGRRRVGRPGRRWLVKVEEDFRRMGMRTWHLIGITGK